MNHFAAEDRGDGGRARHAHHQGWPRVQDREQEGEGRSL